MPLILPGATLPGPPLFDPEQVLEGGRVTRYRFDLLDTDENKIGELTGVQPGGTLEWHSTVAVKGGGTITISNKVGQDVNWLTDRIQVVALISSLNRSSTIAEVPLGVFMGASPDESWNGPNMQRNVELVDKLGIPDQDTPTDAAGNPLAYSLPAGVNVMGVVAKLLNDAGEPTPALPTNDPTVLPNGLTWDIGTSRLQIINDILAASGYFSLSCDMQGQYQALPYVSPANRVPVYTSMQPFEKGETSLMTPEWSRTRNIYGIPNRYIAVSTGDDTNPAMVAVATNTSPDSPFSYANRGNRWITTTATDVEVTSYDALLARAQMGLTQSTSIVSLFTVNHAFLPDLQINSAVQFINPDADLDMLCYVGTTTVPLDPTAMCQSTLTEAVV